MSPESMQILSIISAVVSILSGIITALNAFPDFIKNFLKKKKRPKEGYKKEIKANIKNSGLKRAFIKPTFPYLRLRFSLVLFLIGVCTFFLIKDWPAPNTIPEGFISIAKPGRSFFIYEHEITNREYNKFLASKKYINSKDEMMPIWAHPDYKNLESIRKSYEGFQEGLQPVVGVNYYQAEAYCEWLGKKIGKTVKLPSIEQWEVAAGTMPPCESLSKDAWFIENIDETRDYKRKTRPVRWKNPNKNGLYDMWGNAEEWVLSPADDSIAYLKGGNYADDCKYLRTEYTNKTWKTYRSPKVSFRVVIIK